MGPGAKPPQTREMTVESEVFLDSHCVHLDVGIFRCPLPVGCLFAQLNIEVLLCTNWIRLDMRDAFRHARCFSSQ